MKIKVKTVRVLARDIKEGVRRSCIKCPIAKALHRVFNKKGLMVMNSSILVYNSGLPSS